MPTVTIVAAKVFPPKAGKKRGTIVTPDEVLYGAMPPILRQMNEGGSYEITYKVDHFNGRDYNVIEDVRPATGAAPAPAQARPPTAAPKNPKESEQIAVLAMLKPWMEKIPVGDTEAVVHAIKALRTAYASTFGKAASGSDMNDEIPY